MRSLYVQLAAFVTVLGVAAGCSSAADAPTSGDSAIRELERRAVGKAQPYAAETYTDDDAARFASSKKARRELGWHVLEKLLQPVSIAAGQNVDSGGANTIPLFRTWLGGDELDRMFAKMYGDLGKDRRLAHDLPTDQEMSALFDWNATSLGQNSEAGYFARLAQVNDPEAVDGLAGNPRTAYSPGYMCASTSATTRRSPAATARRARSRSRRPPTLTRTSPTASRTRWRSTRRS